MAANHPILKRFKKAHAKRRLWDPMLADAYAYCLPNYGAVSARTGQTKNDNQRGEKRGLEVFDGTGGEALEDRAAYTVDALFPDSEAWVGAQADLEQIYDKAFADYAKDAFDTVQSAFDNSNFMAEIVTAMREAYISVGTITFDFGTTQNPFNLEALPIGQVTPEDSYDGIIRTNFRKFEIPVSDITAKWPGAKVPQTLTDKGADKPVKIIEAEIFDHASAKATYTVLVETDGAVLFERVDEVGRTIPFRTDKAPGETMGRGPVLAAMPDIKVANKTDELTLKNASIAVTGIWQADDDGVLNPANIKLVPGAIIPKAMGSTGLTPLAAPGRFDVAQLMTEDRRKRIRRKIFGQDLPPIEDAGQSTAFEIGERVRAFETIEGPHLRRLIPELFMRLVKRGLYILMHPSMAGSRYHLRPFGDLDASATLDALMDALEGPDEAVKRKRKDAQADAAVAAAVQLLGEGVSDVVDIKAYLRRRLEREGVAKDLIVDEKAAQANAEQNQMMQMAAMAMQGGGGGANDNATAPPDLSAGMMG